MPLPRGPPRPAALRRPGSTRIRSRVSGSVPPQRPDRRAADARGERADAERALVDGVRAEGEVLGGDAHREFAGGRPADGEREAADADADRDRVVALLPGA